MKNLPTITQQKHAIAQILALSPSPYSQLMDCAAHYYWRATISGTKTGSRYWHKCARLYFIAAATL